MKQKKRKISLKKIISLIAVVCLLLANGITAFASESGASASTAVAEAKQGVLQIQLIYVDQSGNEHILQSGSGFLVGASSGAKTVITNYHVITIANDDVDVFTEMFGVDFSNTNNLDLQIRVIVQGDVPVSATYVNGSRDADFAILDLEQTIYNRTPLKIADSSSLVDAQTIYALGFPGATTNADSSTVYSSSDVTVTSGVVGKVMEISGYSYVLHDASLGHGNSGGPLVDANGAVVGINTMYNGDDSSNYYYSIAINDVRAILDALGIVYEAADGSTDTPETGEAVTEPVPEETQEQETLSAEPETVPAGTVVEPEEEETEASDNKMLIIIIGAAAAAAVVIVIVAVAVTGKKKKNKGNMPGGMPGQIPPQPFNPQNVPGNQQQSRPTPPPTPQYMGAMPVDSGAGETSVLGGGAGETSVLGYGAGQPAATIIRKKNGESARITKPLYIIGKERAKVDFCIPDNSSVSRKHANIICRGGSYFIVDNNSTNYTFVNGNKINPGQEVQLNPGDKIKLADEEFDFRL